MKKLNYIILLCLSIALLTSCGSTEKEENTIESNSEATNESTSELNSNLVEFVDGLGFEVKVEKPEKVAVISGSFADAWLLAGGEISAVTADAATLIEMTPEMVDLGALKSPSIETIIAEDIDFAILSATISEHVELRDTLERAGIQTAYFNVENFDDYSEMMKILTDITGRKDLYKENVEDIGQQIQEQISRADGSKPKVLFLRAYSTGVKAKGSDNMTGQMLKELGCVNIADTEKTLETDLSMEVIIEEDPDFIFVTTMGESQEKALDMVEELLISNPAWSGLQAVENNHYYVLPKELFHNKPNKRWGESYLILGDCLYGDK